VTPSHPNRSSAPTPSTSPALSVFALGSLRIVRDSGPIPESAWVRKKARTLFGYLLCSRPRGVHKEQLMELLWPGADAQRSAHGLQVVLSDLRGVLANGGSTQEGRIFVCRIGDVYSLDVGRAGWVDAEAFEAGCEAGRRAEAAGDREAAIRYLVAAESLYAGDFLVEEQFSDWAAARRERLRDQYLDVLLRLLRHHEAAGRSDMAVEYAKKALAADPYLEPCYRDLMRHSAALGDHGGVLRAYTRCQAAMREGFDSEVSAETRALAAQLLGGRLPSSSGDASGLRPSGGALAVAQGPGLKRFALP
jgi:LuxR family maltose regulon positive regulatory protein